MQTNLLAKRLRELRKAHGYTQDYVAEFLGLVRQAYSHYETGKRTPNPEILYKLAGLYNISIDDLMHLAINLDKNIYYDAPAPTQSSIELEEFLNFLNSPQNEKKYKLFSTSEKELLFYFKQLSDFEKQEIIEIEKLKVRRNKQPKS